MGLDAVELVMEVEDEFGITIPDSAAPELRTVEDLVTLCMERIRATRTVRCPSFSCFLALRRLMRDIRNEPELRIRPRDKVDRCLHSSDRKRLWRNLPSLLETTPPELRRPAWLRSTLVLIVLGFPVLLTVLLARRPEAFPLICFATIALGIILYWLTMGLRTRTPDGYTTFGEITKRMVGLRIATNPPADIDYDNVFAIVKQIIVVQLGVDDDQVVPTARFAEDLGVR